MGKYVELFRVYLESERNMSHNTVVSYVSDLDKFFEFTGKPVTKVSSSDVLSFVVHMRDQGLAVATRGRRLSALKSFYRFMVRKERMRFNPAEVIGSPKLDRRLPRPIDVEDIDRIVDVIDNLRDRVMIEVLYGVGIRREELSTIKVRDINFTYGFVRVIGKGNVERSVPLHADALDQVHELISQQDSEWLFPGYNGTHISNRQINAIIKKWADMVGLDWVTPHKFRHSFGTHLHNNGAELRTIQELMGHANPNTTQIYTKVSSERSRKEYLQFHPRSKKRSLL